MNAGTADRAVELAQALMEEDTSKLFGRDGGVAFRLFLDTRFPGITRDEIRRGMEIAVECELMDGSPEL